MGYIDCDSHIFENESTWDYLETLRSLKNAAFFGSLQEEQVRKYE